MLDAKDLPRLRSGRDGQLVHSLQRGHLQRHTEDGLRHGDVARVDEVVAPPLEVGMRLHSDVDEEVARLSTSGRRRPPARQPQSLTIVDAAGYLYLYRSIGEHASVAATVATLRQDAAPGAFTHRAR